MRKLILVLLLGGQAVSAFAGNGDLAAIDHALNALFDISTGVAANSPFIEDGRRLFGLLLLILISWSGLQVMLDSGGLNAALARLIKVILMAGICSFMMQPTNQQSLAKGFDYLAGKAASSTGSKVDMSNPAQGIKTVIGTGLRAAQQLWSSSGEARDKASWMNEILNGQVAELVLGLLGETAAKIIISLLIIITLGIYAFVVVSTMILVQIGLITAPLFIPWLLWESSAFLFNGWLKFMVTSGVSKIVAALLLGMTFNFLDAVEKLAASAAASPVYDEFAYFAAALLSLLMAFTMLQVPSIAAGLVSGLPSVSISVPRWGGGNSKQAGSPPRPPPPNPIPK